MQKRHARVILNTQVHRFGHGHHSHAEYHVVADLGDQTRTGRAAVHPPGSHGLEQVFSSSQRIRVAAHHERQRTLFGAHHSCRNDNVLGEYVINDDNTIKPPYDGNDLTEFSVIGR